MGSKMSITENPWNIILPWGWSCLNLKIKWEEGLKNAAGCQDPVWGGETLFPPCSSGFSCLYVRLVLPRCSHAALDATPVKTAVLWERAVRCLMEHLFLLGSGVAFKLRLLLLGPCLSHLADMCFLALHLADPGPLAWLPGLTSY